MPVKIQSTSQIALSQGNKILVYGNAGMGKTWLCQTAPAPIIVSAESGLKTLRKVNLPAIPINNYSDLQDVYAWVMSSKEANQFKTICLDSASEIAEVVLNEEKKRNKDPRKAYGETQDQIIAMFRNFRDIQGKNVYFSAKQEFTVDGTTGAKYFAPMFPGNKLGQAIPYFFDSVFQLMMFKDAEGKDFRALRTRGDNQNIAKDRSGVLDEWEPPDLTYLFSKMDSK